MTLIQLPRSGVAIALAALCLAGCGLITPSAEPSAAHQTTVRVADIPLVTQVPFYVGLDRGYFRDEGLDLQLVPTSSTSEAVTLVATSKVELGGFGPDPATFNAMGQGIGMKMLGSAAVFADGTRASGLVVRQDLIDNGQYHRPADLRGKRIAVSAAQAQFYVELTLARDGVQADAVSFVRLDNADMLPALANHAIDAAWEVEPLIGALQKQKLGTLTATGLEALPGGIPWILFESSAFAQTDLTTRTAFMRAYLRGLRDFYHAFNIDDGPRAPVIASLAAHTSVHDASTLASIGMHTVDPNAALDASVLDSYQAYYLKSGDQLRAVDLSEFVDQAPLSEAVEELGRL